MIVKLLTEHHLECLSLKGGCRGSSESSHVKMPHCLNFHALAQFCQIDRNNLYIPKSLSQVTSNNNTYYNIANTGIV